VVEADSVESITREGSSPKAVRQGWHSRAVRDPAFHIAVGTFVIYSYYALTRYRQFLTAGYDLGIFDQAIRAYSHLRAPIVPLKGAHYNILADHFHPIIATLAPLYWLWDDPRVLLLAQAALIAVSCVFVFRFASRRFTTPTSTLMTIGYALGWPIQGMVDFDFHEIAFAVPLLAWSLDALDRRKDRELVFAAVALLLVREDMGAVVAVIGVVRALQRRPRWVGAALSTLGVATFALVVGVVIPKFAGGTYGYWEYPSLGADPSAAPGAILGHPMTVLEALFSPDVKLWTLLLLLAPLLLLPLASPLSLVAIPILAERFLSSRQSLWTTEFHYNAPVWIILTIGAMDGLSRLLRRSRSEQRRARIALTAASVVCAFPILMSTLWEQTFPLTRLVDGSAYVVTSHMIDQARATAAIPAGTCVAADDRLVPRLTRTNRVTVPGVSGPPEDFYVLDFSEPFPADHSAADSTEEIARSITAEGYVVRSTFGELTIFVSPHYTGPTKSCGAAR
jgi:uncharacterized membrane protein